MGVIVDETELSCSIAPARFFKAFLDNKLLPKIVPTFMKSIQFVEGKGEVGSIKMITFYEGGVEQTLKHRIEEVDEKNLVYTFNVVEGLNLGVDFESVRSVHKVEAGSNGGCVLKVTATYTTKGDNQTVIEENIKKAKEGLVAFFNATAAHLNSNPNEYN